jgi:molecular chaperone GrpE (heat shock protein)
MEKQTGERIAQLEREVSELRDAKAKSEAEMQEFVRESIRRDFEGV